MALNKNAGTYGDDCAGPTPTGVTDVYGDPSVHMALNNNAGSYGGDCAGPTLAGVTDVYGYPSVYMALNKTAGATQRWGFSSYGGDCARMTLTGVTDVYSVHRPPGPERMQVKHSAGEPHRCRWSRKFGVHGRH